MDTKKTIRLVGIGLILAVILGLGGWYLYLRQQGDAIREVSEGRGFTTGTPSFTGEGGSTFENIIEGLGFQRESTAPEPTDRPRLWRALATPGAGHGFISGATSTRLRFIERSTGYLFESDTLTGKTLRLTNTLIPRIHEAVFTGTGIPAIQRIEGDRVQTSTLTYRATSTPEAFGNIEVTSLGAVSHIAVHPKKEELMSLVGDGKEFVLIRSSWSGGRPERAYSSSLRDWRIVWLEDNSVILSQAPASGIPGSAFRLEEGALIPIIRSIPGLTLLPKSKSGPLLISSDSGAVSLGSRGNIASSTVTLPIRTVADKCVWSPGAQAIAYCAVPERIPSQEFLNDWYQGRIHTSDSWWRIDASLGTVEPLFSSASMNVSVDVEKPVINDTGEYIAFRNAYDKSVWVLRIKE